jgi:hypothetical protein
MVKPGRRNQAQIGDSGQGKDLVSRYLKNAALVDVCALEFNLPLNSRECKH